MDETFNKNIDTLPDGDRHEDLLDQVSEPMGISQWAAYGKKYGYWDYFEKRVIEELKSKI